MSTDQSPFTVYEKFLEKKSSLNLEIFGRMTKSQSGNALSEAKSSVGNN